MPSRKTTRAAKANAARMPSIPRELLDQIEKQGPMTAETIQQASMAFKKALIERAMSGELSHHLGYGPGQDKPKGATNHRNGKSAKTVLTEDGPLHIEVPRDREGSFEPILIPKHERRFKGFDERIVAMYARGMTVREIQGLLMEQYGTEVSAEFISSVTDEVMEEVQAWQSRPLETMYPVVFFDALRVKIRESGVVRNKAVYLALGILPDGSRDVLGLWIENTEGARFWMKVFNDLRNRGVADILIAVTDGLKGIAEALEAVFPATTLQTCIVHLIRNNLEYASWKEVSAQPSTRFSASRRQNRCPLDSGGHLFWRLSGKTMDIRSAAMWRRPAMLRPARPALPPAPTGAATAHRSDSWAASAAASAHRSGMPADRAR